MKKAVSYAVALAMAASFNIALPTAASAGQENNPNNLWYSCQTRVDNGAMTMNECRAKSLEYCTALLEKGTLQDRGFENFGDCMARSGGSDHH